MQRFAPAVLLAALAAATCSLAGEPAQLPDRLDVAKARVKLELTLATSWASSDHKLRAMDDTARVEAAFELTPRGGGAVDAEPETLHVTRRKHGHVHGIFSDDWPEAKGEAHWTKGSGTAPPAWSMIVSPRGEAVADVKSSAPVWHVEGFLQGCDRSADEDARLKRLVHYLDLGFFGAPVLARGDRFDVTRTLELGESGLTNKLVTVEVTYALTVTKEADVLKVAGPLKAIKLVKGEGASKSVDQWLDVAFARGGPTATGELAAVFDSTKKTWREVKETLSLDYRGSFDGGSGRATFERKLRASWE